MNIIKQCDPETLAKYAHENQLTNKVGWKWARRYSKDPNRFIQLSRTFVARRGTQIKYKFGIQIPLGIKQAFKFDLQHGNNKWREAIDKEITELMKMNTFKIVSDRENIPEGYNFIPVHSVFDAKVNERHKV